MPIPCLENKCIKFPVCRNKHSILCNDLCFYIIRKRKELQRDDNYNDEKHLWKDIIEKIFPNVEYVSYDKGNY